MATSMVTETSARLNEVRLRKDVLHIALSALQDRLADEAGKQKRLASLLKVVLKARTDRGQDPRSCCKSVQAT